MASCRVEDGLPFSVLPSNPTWSPCFARAFYSSFWRWEWSDEWPLGQEVLLCKPLPPVWPLKMPQWSSLVLCYIQEQRRLSTSLGKVPWCTTHPSLPWGCYPRLTSLTTLLCRLWTCVHITTYSPTSLTHLRTTLVLSLVSRLAQLKWGDSVLLPVWIPLLGW